MGIISSKDFMEMVENDNPSTPVTSKRLVGLDFDPRSPTVGITRTPIQIEKTPQKMVDPRSPTVGIWRTPIVSNGIETDESNATEVSVISSLSVSSYGSNHSLIDIQPLTMQEALRSLPPIDFQDDEDKNTEEPQNKTQEPDLAQTPIQKPNRMDNTLRAEKDSKVKSSPFQVHSDEKDTTRKIQQATRKTFSDDFQRSPMGKCNIDVSSPRHIVQRKQTNKLDRLKAIANSPISKPVSPCRMEIVQTEDKENMSM